MSNPKPIDANQAAQRIINAGKPVIDRKFTPSPDPRQAPPEQKPLPAALAKALGQS
ncbi:hypothetical protein ACQR0Z_17390 [Bradyrhizobium sp. HKCCYLS3077]|uniref:hypothetical protein n=1 Tax=Bradyrhizobium sp. HKCCYLS3077 TaxID=3420761 RepID=UPI003EB8DD49